METVSATDNDTDNRTGRRWEWLFLLLVLLLSLSCVFCATGLALQWRPTEADSTSLLANSQANYFGSGDNAEFAVLNPRLGDEAATDIARLSLTPTGRDDEPTFTIASLPPTPTATPGGTPLPLATRAVTPGSGPAGGGSPVAPPAAPGGSTGTPGPAPSATSPAGLPSPTSPLPPLLTATSTPGPSGTPPFSSPTPNPASPTATHLPGGLPPTSTPPPPPTGHPTGNPPPTSRPPTSPPPTVGPPTFTPSATVPPASPTPSPTPVLVTLSGRVFEDVDYVGGAGTPFGSGDAGLGQAQVELYDGLTLVMTVTTEASGVYTMTGVASPGTYLLRVVSASLGDNDTPPAGGYNPGFLAAVPEQTYEHNGLSGNGGAGALGGNSPASSDLNTPESGGPGDTNVTLTLTGTDVTGLDFGFAFNLVSHGSDSDQGSLRQAMLNSNAISGPDRIVFNLIGPGLPVIQPSSLLPTLTDPVIIDGFSQPGFAGSPLIELDGSGVTGDGLRLTAGGSLVQGLIINSFSGGSAIRLEGGSGSQITANYLGTDRTGTLVLGNETGLVIADSANNLIGGPAPAEGNLIAGNVNDGLQLTGAGTSGNQISHNTIATNGGSGIAVLSGRRNAIRRNELFANGGLGIDLGGDGLTNNDLGDGDGGPNDRLNAPVLTVAAIDSGTTLLIEGEARPNSLVELFQANPDPSGHGEGQRFIAEILVDGSTPGLNDPTARRFSLSMPAGPLLLGDQVTATAIDSEGNTSEFATNATLGLPPIIISGRVFEEVTYSGGNGSNFGTGDAPLPNVRVELYENTTFITNTTTNATGNYAFDIRGLLPPTGVYTVRVVAATIGDGNTPPAGGFNSGFNRAIAEQSFEHDGLNGNGGGGARGGNDPAVSDLSTPAGAGPGDTNVAVSVNNAGVSGVNFGFVYTLVSNTNPDGQGSFTQALSNANAIGGRDTVFFNLYGPAPYTLQPNPLPNITDPIIIDGQSEPDFSGRPVIELDGTIAGGGLVITAGDSTVRGLAINRAGIGLDLRSRGNNIIQGNFLGTDPTGTFAPGGQATGLRLSGASGNIIGGNSGNQRNLISGNSSQGILVENVSIITRTTTGLQTLYTFQEGSGTTVSDVSSVGAALNLTIQDPGNVTWSSAGLQIDSTTTISATGPADKIFNACTASNEITLEAWLAPANTGQSGPARIITFSQDDSNRNFTLAQDGNRYVAWLRTTTNGDNGDSTVLSSPAGSVSTSPTQLVFTRAADGTATLYLNGIPVDSTNLGGDFSNWNAGYAFGLANEFGGVPGRGWGGSLQLVGVYCQALDDTEINRNFNVVASNLIQYNWIGTEFGGGGVLGNGSGIRLNNAGRTLIANNVIAHSTTSAGVRVSDNGNTVSANSLFNNSGLGIDFNDDGLSPNDTGDLTDPLNFPVLASATISGTTVLTVTGEARPNSRVEFFITDAGGDPNGEGRQYIGFGLVNSGVPGATDPTAWQFTFGLPLGAVLPGDEITATATDPGGTTSEFAANITAN